MKLEKLSAAIEVKNIADLKANQDNPREITENDFEKLVKSIKEFPKMLFLRPIVVDKNNVIQGGNMRYEACKKLGLKEVPTINAKDFTEKELKQFLIKDNVNLGTWSWDKLANEWDSEQLNEWGLNVWKTTTEEDLKELFKEDEQTKDELKEDKKQITLNYTEEDYDKVIKAFSELKGSKEEIIFNLIVKE